MTATAKILALIPARSGSKSVPDKNVREFAGKPLLAHSIEQAYASHRIQRVIVSTDSERYAAIARSYGAETPFLRPTALADDDATDLVVFQHALAWLHDHEGWQPDIVVHLRPTYPNREPADIDRVVDVLLADPSLDSVRTVVRAPETPYKMWTRDTDALLTPVADLGTEAYNQPRQMLPEVFLQNACIDAVRSRVILEQGSMSGRRIHGYLMRDHYDIDSFADLERARAGAAGRGRSPPSFCLDFDTVLTQGSDPAREPRLQPRLQPRPSVVDAVRRLHAAGCRIVVQTRSDVAPRADAPAGQDARALLDAWAVPYHDVTCDAAATDYLVDGRAIGLDQFLAIAAALAGEAIPDAVKTDHS